LFKLHFLAGRKSKQIKLEATTRRVSGGQDQWHASATSDLETGFVSNALHFFAVPKGGADIRVAFDGTSSGLNETLWAPNLYLPSAKSGRLAAVVLRYFGWRTWIGGEMFHNFFMDWRCSANVLGFQWRG
jgi:hypothetical protein